METAEVIIRSQTAKFFTQKMMTPLPIAIVSISRRCFTGGTNLDVSDENKSGSSHGDLEEIGNLT
jgi:hypothetical protein